MKRTMDVIGAVLTNRIPRAPFLPLPACMWEKVAIQGRDGVTVLYRTELDGEVLFFAMRELCEDEYHAEFKIQMVDGSIEFHRGYWSSRAEVCNRAFPQYPPLADLSALPNFWRGVAQRDYSKEQSIFLTEKPSSSTEALDNWRDEQELLKRGE